jgi:hypothetical protein
MQLDSVKKILQQSLLEKYGVDNFSKHPEFKNRFRKSCQERYGVDHPMHVPEFKQNQIDSYINHYGVTHSNKDVIVKEKKRTTWLLKYGYSNPSQVPEIKLKKYITLKENGFIKSDEEKTLQKAYYDNVAKYTIQNWFTHYYDINPRKLKRSFEDYHLDHIYSVIDGFNNNIKPEIIGHWTNLQLLPKMENICKQRRSDKTLEKLYEDYNSNIVIDDIIMNTPI